MGLADRDYMRERHTSARLRASRLVRPAPGAAIPWWRIVLVAAVLAVVFFVVKYSAVSRRVVAFPSTGEVLWYREVRVGQTAQLMVVAPPQDSENFVLLLDEWEGKAPVAMIPVRSGETAVVQVPLGRYRLTIANGKMWQGWDKKFGLGGDTRVAVAPLEFYRQNGVVMGHRIELAKRFDGNLQTRPAGWF